MLKFEFIIIGFMMLTFIPIVLATSITISCPSCQLNNCQCSITNCSSGSATIYNKANCQNYPIQYLFSNETLVWSPTQYITYSMKVLCDDGNISDCANVTIELITPTTTIQGEGGGGGGGGSCKQLGYVCSDNNQCCSGLTCKDKVCINQTSTSAATRTTTTSETTITTQFQTTTEIAETSETTTTTEAPLFSLRTLIIAFLAIIVITITIAIIIYNRSKLKQNKSSSTI